MKKKLLKKLTLPLLIGITVANLFFAVPSKVDGCACYRDGKLFCTGNCCGGTTQCDCYDVGTDNCHKAPAK